MAAVGSGREEGGAAFRWGGRLLSAQRDPSVPELAKPWDMSPASEGCRGRPLCAPAGPSAEGRGALPRVWVERPRKACAPLYCRLRRLDDVGRGGTSVDPALGAVDPALGAPDPREAAGETGWPPGKGAEPRARSPTPAPAWAALTHSHARVSEGRLQSDLHGAGVAFVLFGDQIRSDK